MPSSRRTVISASPVMPGRSAPSALSIVSTTSKTGMFWLVCATGATAVTSEGKVRSPRAATVTLAD